ncbi:MAG: UDP-glucose--lipopolysaccharide core heptose 4-beta-glucosyltransferase [Deltaproteobacteria bacterium]|nr:UDP-glucose--lipopolysaccharide core heptose 4-beta-glucosyltransferase [Deltaproteobacteria bacterium]MBP2687877.1 UDP-glucose--lipopolysaccharide core heptose 4-beta-glucosyltransferase [Deltaproteobacteria bacterium]MBS1243521.1 UDP-glucose--lipopolysaccharide core heptose 4-beta-glucosyltransferase [Deltaproteobacteria bacterium]
MTVSARRPVSAVVISFNEERNIGECLESLRWADEIVVVDSGSSDGTPEIARRYTDKFFRVPWRGFGPQKQAAVEQASHDVVLNVDCDERVTPELAEEICRLLAMKGMAAAYTVPRRTFVGGKEIRHCGWYPDRTIRLFDRTKARFSPELVHERVEVSGDARPLRNHLLHHSFSGIGDILAKMNRYSDLSARQMFERGRRSGISDLTVRPAFAFLKTYFLRLGMLDGFEGLVISVTTALLTFAKYVKLRELERKRP